MQVEELCNQASKFPFNMKGLIYMIFLSKLSLRYDTVVTSATIICARMVIVLCDIVSTYS